ncbi:MAG: hypothetical protein DRI52_11520 [Chloroflexi bacterium]|nr:MAG: hypothetical protein DRI52_11520 [Chloroflexota bacterium]
MALCWVKAGECGEETTIEARKISPTKMVFDITTTCEHIQALAEALGEVNVGSEMSRPLNETRVYTLATEHVCRNSCIVPAAILKAMEVTAGIFLPGDCSIEFVEGVV